MFKKILLPISDRDHADNLVRYTQELAGKYDAEVFILHSYYMPERFNAHESSHYHYLKVAEERMELDGKTLLEELKQRFDSKNIKCEVILQKGIAGGVIVTEAQKIGCDLIIMGTRGLGHISSILISSTSNHVIHHSKCPVLLVH